MREKKTPKTSPNNIQTDEKPYLNEDIGNTIINSQTGISSSKPPKFAINILNEENILFIEWCFIKKNDRIIKNIMKKNKKYKNIINAP
ncbi:MAG: hypothetical protein GX362_01205 [Methanosarcinaceae archaeon]|nr:hypothetical protein [Methanosarcinaceae archaeon]